MSGGDERASRRDNGLVAEDYTAIGAIHPDEGERVLHALAAEGIAAYIESLPLSSSATNVTPSEQASVERPATDSAPESDRLFADATRIELARSVIDQERKQTDEGQVSMGLDFDTAFATIVANLAAEENHTIPSWPQAQPWPQVEDGPAEDRPAEDRPFRRRRTDRDRSGLPIEPFHGGPDPAAEGDNDEDDEEGYTPPPAPPIPPLSPRATAAILLILVGMILFLWPSLLPIQPRVTLTLGFCGTLGGCLILLWRLRPNRDEDDPDDGARV